MRLERLEALYPGQVEFEWRSYILRPNPRPPAASEEERASVQQKYLRYTRSWERPAADPDAFPFAAWACDDDPPTHSIPSHLVSKAAARVGADAFKALHRRLLHAYFQESRDISSFEILAELWSDVGLPADDFAVHADPAIRAQVYAEHQQALQLGVSGVPTVQLVGNDALIVGAQPFELYQRWVERSLERLGG